MAAHDEETHGARLADLQLDTWLAAAMCGTWVVTSAACVVGKSMLFRRADLARVGGWPALRDVLAVKLLGDAQGDRFPTHGPCVPPLPPGRPTTA